MGREPADHGPPRPRAKAWGPGFLRPDAWPYRVEMAIATVSLLIVLFYWRLFAVGDLNVGLTVFWILWPDLAAFIPIGIAMRNRKEWPAWGPSVYNAVHTFLVWFPVFAVWSVIAGRIEWPLLGWAGHITADRAFGYYLRARTSEKTPPARGLSSSEPRIRKSDTP